MHIKYTITECAVHIVCRYTFSSLDFLCAKELLKQFLAVFMRCGGSQKKYTSSDSLSANGFLVTNEISALVPSSLKQQR